MRTLLKAAVAAALLYSTASWAAPASESSIKELLAVSQAQKLLDTVYGQFDSLIDNAVQRSLHGKVPTPKQLQVLARMKQRTAQIVREELSWEKLEPVYVRLYSNSFTEEEVTGMLAFYKTPAGQAVIHKLPVLVVQTMREVQQASGPTLQKIADVQQQLAVEFEAAGQ